MAEIWGLMPKSQENAQTIDEAIAEAIAVHEADPTSHMGDGESIDVHRKNDVIDHPASSIPFDKTTQLEQTYRNNFDLTADYTQEGTVSGVGNGYMKVGKFHVASAISLAWVNVPFFQQTDFPSKSIIFQGLIMFEWNTIADKSHFVFGGLLEGSDDGFGLYLDNSVVYFGLWQGGVLVDSVPVAMSNGYSYIIRMEISPIDGVARCFMDGENVAEITLGAVGVTDFTGIFVYAESTLTTYSYITTGLWQVAYTVETG